MTHATAAYALSGLPFTVDETAVAGLQTADTFHADELVGEYLGSRQQPTPEVVSAAIMISWDSYQSNKVRVPSWLNSSDGYTLTARATIEQPLGPEPQHWALRGTMALYASPYTSPIGSPRLTDDDLLVCTIELLSEISGAPLNLPAPSTGVARLRFRAVSLTAWGAMYWPAPNPFYLEMTLELAVQSSSTEPDMLQGSARLHFADSR